MESQIRIHSRSGWQETETNRLLKAVQEANASGVPLRAVFENLSGDLGRKPNSIRNYYYACLRENPGAAPRSPAFTTFTPEETHRLIREVLLARGRGMSVRACVMQMAGGNHSQMLRYQNKYRAILRSHPELIAQVCEELRQEGLPCPTAPAAQRIDHADAAFCDPDDAAAVRLMAQPCVHHMLEGLKELLRRAARSEEAGMMQQTLDRQRVQHDLQRIAWEKDFDECASHLSDVMAALRSFLAPAQDASPDAAAERTGCAMSALRCAEEFLEKQKHLTH